MNATTTYQITDWRETTERDYCGDPVLEAHVEGHGWCRFSRRLAAVWVGGAYRTRWSE